MTNATQTNRRHFAANKQVKIDDDFIVNLLIAMPDSFHFHLVFKKVDGKFRPIGHARIKITDWHTTDSEIRRAVAAM